MATIKSNLDTDSFMVYEIFLNEFLDNEINGIIGSLCKKKIIEKEIDGIFKLKIQ